MTWQTAERVDDETNQVTVSAKSGKEYPSGVLAGVLDDIKDHIENDDTTVWVNVNFDAGRAIIIEEVAVSEGEWPDGEPMEQTA